MSTDVSSQWGSWPAQKVRETYLDYFKQQQHTFVPSSSTIPYEDPTLLFANAGSVHRAFSLASQKIRDR